MNVFEFRNQLVAEYEKFTRSFTRIRAQDIEREVESRYNEGKFWPAPLVYLNPRFQSGGYIRDLVKQGVLDAECERIFRIKNKKDTRGKALRLYKHQRDGIEIAKRGQSYVLTTGTGSGKSLAYFIPIIDDVIRRRRAGDGRKGITAIVVYPMNALCNSQREELERYLCLGYEEGQEPVTFARYTGQESQEERDRIAENPPDILLTNYVMLELIMTRFQDTDKAVRRHAEGLKFLVLDELHTYRGRQGADVAMLVRRVRERFNKDLQCIGTSATMASEGSAQSRNEAVAGVASLLFGDTVAPDNVVAESLSPVTDDSTKTDKTSLCRAIQLGVPKGATHDELAAHPVAAWVERTLGLEQQDGRLIRITRPLTLQEATERLAADSGINLDECESYLTEFLLASHQCRDENGLAFFAFRLHQFISCGWNVYSTLEGPGERYLTLQGQRFKPGDRDRPLFPLSFCRRCGQEYIPVWAHLSAKEPTSFTPRELYDRASDEEEIRFGYLMPSAVDTSVETDVERQYPEEWLEHRGGTVRVKAHLRRYRPIPLQVDTQGKVAEGGMPVHFIPESFRYCLNPDCDAVYSGHVRSEFRKLSRLSSEGRSSATTILTLSSLKYLIGSGLDERTKKLLAFTDNRQDASLQAGHFNDFVQILLLRGALLAAMRGAGGQPLKDDCFTQKVLNRLRLHDSDYASNPGAKGTVAERTRETLRQVIGYRLYCDLQRGWRINNPNIEQLGLLRIDYQDLINCCEDQEEWLSRHPLLGSISAEGRFEIAKQLLELMRRALCIKTRYLDPIFHESLRNRSHTSLNQSWGLIDGEKLSAHRFMVPRPSLRRKQRGSNTYHVSHRSKFGGSLKTTEFWGADNPHFPEKFDEETYNRVVDDILDVLKVYGLVVRESLDQGRNGYLINGSVLEWREADPVDVHTKEAPNEFFRDLYENVADLLDSRDRLLHRLEAREHTAQVDAELREEREHRFRRGMQREGASKGLPVLYCSPTMELGVDIATLNAVYMRNVPPTPANYAQRSGRAGRSGQPALVVTYCAPTSPHDQYFFSDPTRMVAGVVNPPSIDLANEDLIRSHLQAVWLAETGVKLGYSVPEVLDLEDSKRLPLDEGIAQQIGSPRVVENATRRAEGILSTLESMLTKQAAPWYTASWRKNAMASAEERFNKSFNRWRSLFSATVKQMRSANATIENAAATETDRREAKGRYDEAFTQQKLLLGSIQTFNSDFYTYRYLAAEGFLPGYNFPRLPLLAFIPGMRMNVGRNSFLSRPRFLGLSEFGPQAIIYHEGSTYRVRRVIFSVTEETITVGGKLPVQAARLCPSCGYGHFSEQRDFECCVSCNESLEGGKRIETLHRIDQVSTRRAYRITSDEEERQRQGYEMISTLRFSEERGRTRVDVSTIEYNGEPILEFKYGPAARIWRINLGWRRRKAKSVFGFSVDPTTGEWTRDSQAPTDVEDDSVGDGKTVQRITPYVQDSRNALIVRPMVDEFSEEAMVSLQYALKRGIEQEFQLEESELAAEPLPDRDQRSTILFYEAAEGGAGVLTRVASGSDVVSKVARRALEVCHYASKSGGWKNVNDLEDRNDNCEAGCYHCLLSYYNQWDHDLIDRKNKMMVRQANSAQYSQ